MIKKKKLSFKHFTANGSADFSSFWDLENSFLFKLSPRSIDLLKSTLFALNYRDVNERFFHKYIAKTKKPR